MAIISLRNTFFYILEKKGHKEYIGCYKDQKVYSYWDNGFVEPINIYDTCTKKIMCFYYFQLKHRKLWVVINGSVWCNLKLWDTHIITKKYFFQQI